MYAGGGAAEIAGAAGLNLVTILNSSFVNNSAPNGGAIALKEDADLSIAAGSRLAGNHATSAGGAVQLQGTARLQVSGSALENNTGAVFTSVVCCLLAGVAVLFCWPCLFDMCTASLQASLSRALPLTC